MIDKAAEAGKMATGVDGREVAAKGVGKLQKVGTIAASSVSDLFEDSPFEMPKMTMAAMKVGRGAKGRLTKWFHLNRNFARHSTRLSLTLPLLTRP